MADPQPVLTILVQKGPCKGETRRGRAGAALRVGRVVKGNHLAVRDAGASQTHLSVEFLKPPAAQWAVTDLGSSNGTLLNGEPLVPTVPAPLSHGDLIKIGESTVLAVSILADEGPGPAPAATRRSARNAAVAAVAEEEQGPAPAVTRRAGRKKAAAAAAPEAEKEVKEEAVVPTRRGGRKRARDPPDAEKEVEEEAAVPTRRGGQKKARDPPDAEKEVEEEAAVPTRRGGRKKARDTPDAEKEVEEEAAVPTRRGGRKKAAEPPEMDTEEKVEEMVVPRRGGRRKAAVTAALPPQPQNTRSTRAAARRGDALGSGNDEVDVTARGQVPATRASARKRKAAQAVPEEDEEEGEVPVTRDQVGNPPKATDVKGGEQGDMVETRDGTSNTSEEAPVAGRGRATKASARKAEDAIMVDGDEKEQEESGMADGRECRGSPRRLMAANDCGEEDKVATGDNKLDRTSKASMEDEKMVGVEEEDAPLAPKGRTIEGRVNAQHATANNDVMEEGKGKDSSRGGENEVNNDLREKVLPESKLEGVREDEGNDKREALGGSGEEEGLGKEGTGTSSLENMTLGEWFVRIEKYLLAKNEEAAEKAIAEVQEKHRRFCEHLKTLNMSSVPS